MTQLHVCHDALLSSCMWRDVFIYVTWLMHTSDTTLLRVCHDSWIRVAGLIRMCNLTVSESLEPIIFGCFVLVVAYCLDMVIRNLMMMMFFRVLLVVGTCANTHNVTEHTHTHSVTHAYTHLHTLDYCYHSDSIFPRIYAHILIDYCDRVRYHCDMGWLWLVGSLKL